MNRAFGAEKNEKSKLVRTEDIYQKLNWTAMTTERFIENSFYGT